MLAQAVNKVVGVVGRNVTSMGEKLLHEIVEESPIGFATEVVERFELAVETGGVSELERFIKHVIGAALLPRSLPHAGLLNRLFKGHHHRAAKWERGGWATSRQNWVADKWQHDWHSQPRVPAGSLQTVRTKRGEWHAGGEWAIGRSLSPVASLTSNVSRKQRGIRRRKRVNRKIVRDAMRGIVSSFGQE